MLLGNYFEQEPTWPTDGRHILAQYDDDSIVVYQAYRESTAAYAVEHQRFGRDFSFSRMSWIKPNFLWMMYRSGWATKPAQERILAVRIGRDFFEEILVAAVPSTFDSRRFDSPGHWKEALATSEVRLQWDPDHDPSGTPLARKALQLGLRGNMLRRYATEEIVSIEDITGFVLDQRAHATSPFSRLAVPVERVLRPADSRAADAVGLDV